MSAEEFDMRAFQLTPETIEDFESGDFDENDFEQPALLFLRSLWAFEKHEMVMSNEDVDKVCGWIDEAMTTQALVSMICRGQIYLLVHDNEVVFALAPAGYKIAREAFQEFGMEVPEALEDRLALEDFDLDDDGLPE